MVITREPAEGNSGCFPRLMYTAMSTGKKPDCPEGYTYSWSWCQTERCSYIDFLQYSSNLLLMHLVWCSSWNDKKTPEIIWPHKRELEAEGRLTRCRDGLLKDQFTKNKLYITYHYKKNLPLGLPWVLFYVFNPVHWFVRLFVSRITKKLLSGFHKYCVEGWHMRWIWTN